MNVSSVSPLCYPSAFGIDTSITIVKIICNDVVDEIIEVAGDYVPSEYLEGASIAFEYRSRHYEAIAEFNEELSDFFLGSMIPTLALTGTVLKDAAPSLVTPEGAVVETSAAAIGATAVTGEAVWQHFAKVLHTEIAQLQIEMKTYRRNFRIRSTIKGLKMLGKAVNIQIKK